MKTAIITGITGQDSAYLSQQLIEKGYKIVGLNNNTISQNFSGLEYLGIKDQVTVEHSTMMDLEEMKGFLTKYKPCEVYNLAAQSSVGKSFAIPFETIQFNLLSVLCMLEAIRAVDPKIKFFQATSGEIFGNPETVPVTEACAIDPISPYSVSKMASHFTLKNYRDAYGLFACSAIFFNHESYLRPDTFVIKKVIKEALNIKTGKQEIMKIGNVDVTRDFGYAPKYMEAVYLMMQQEKPDDFIICSGKPVSLKDIITYIFDTLDISRDKIVSDPALYRPADIDISYGDNSKAKSVLGWDYDMDFFAVLDLLIEEEIRNHYPELQAAVR